MIGFYHRDGENRSLNAIQKLKKLFNDHKIEFIDICGEVNLEKLHNLELLIVFGGDGSVLRASKIAKEDIPIVAINTGNVGFLTSYEEDNLDQLVDDICQKKLVFSNRRFMSVIVKGTEYFALNDAVITKNYMIDSASECVKINFEIDDQFVDSYVADGLILSTPTGSTAYAISAGGPIMVPNVNVYVAAPICAHTLHSKPIVYPDNSLAKVVIHKNSKPCALFIDGKYETSLEPDTVVLVKASNKFARICDNTGKFFSRLSQKLNKWSSNDILR